jgi:ribosomal protein S18 acetylase RimI-like enzyme
MVELIEYGPIAPNRWEDYRNLWLEALKETPEAFSADYETQSKVSESVWKERLNSVIQEDDAVMVFAKLNNKIIGMIGAYFDDNPKFRHIATIWGAYVKPEYRKQGVATRMANILFEKISEKKDIKKIKTYSITNGHLAVNVYQHFGFDIIGISKEELRIGDSYFDVYIMEKRLR